MSATKQTRDVNRFHILLMGAVDGELNSKERAELEQLLVSNTEYRKEYDDYIQLKEALKDMQFKNPPVEIWDTYWIRIYNRIERGLGWILLSIGSIIMLSFAGIELFKAILSDPGIPGIIKAGILSVVGGLAILLVSVFRERLFTYKTDPYKEIKR